MATTFTARLGLTKPDPVDFYDVAVWNANSDKIDADMGGATVCTSGARPSVPYQGQLIYETDSKNFYVRSGVLWLPVDATTLCTASTRPASGLRFPGQLIYETDTGNALVRNAADSAWIPLSPQSVADGTARDVLGASGDFKSGALVYRRDTKILEIQDGAGTTVYRGVSTIQSVAALTDISDPFSNQMVFLTTDGLLYRYNGGLATWQTFALQCNLRQTVAQSIANGTFTSVTYTTEDKDTHGAHSTVTNTSRVTVPILGDYELSGAVSIDASATGGRVTRWAKNGTAINGSSISVPALSSGTVVPMRTIPVTLAATDYIEAQFFQNSGGALNTLATGENMSSVSVRQII